MYGWKEMAEKLQPGMLVRATDGSYLKVRKVVVEIRVSYLGVHLDTEPSKVRVFFVHGTSQVYQQGDEVTTLAGIS